MMGEGEDGVIYSFDPVGNQSLERGQQNGTMGKVITAKTNNQSLMV